MNIAEKSDAPSSYSEESNRFDTYDQGLVSYSVLEIAHNILTVLNDEGLKIISSVDEFQYRILRYFFALLSVSLLGIWFAWNKYGDRISERFTKQVSSRSLEEFIEEAKKLQLPKEHTPRI